MVPDRGLALGAQSPRRVRCRLRCDVRFGQRRSRLAAGDLEGIDPQIERGGRKPRTGQRVAFFGGEGAVDLRPQPIRKLGSLGGAELGTVGLESFGPGSLVAHQGRLQIAQADSQLPQRHRDRQQARRRASRLRAQRAQSSQCGEGPFGNECAITLTQAGMAAKKIAQCRVRRLGERQHRSERVGQRAELARTDHCCAMVSST